MGLILLVALSTSVLLLVCFCRRKKKTGKLFVILKYPVNVM